MVRKLTQFVLALAFLAQAQTGLAAIITFNALLDGEQEVPSNGSNATGTSALVLDTDLDTLQIDVTFGELVGGPAAAAHIHCCAAPGTTAGVAIDLGATLPNATAGSFSVSFDLTLDTTYGANFLANNGGNAAGAQAALTSGLLAGLAYVNIHNAEFPGGEIRGRLNPPAAAPAPSTLALFALGALAALQARRRRVR
jgi:hypothetical protein